MDTWKSLFCLLLYMFIFFYNKKLKKIVTAIMENSLSVPQKIKNRTTIYDPGITQNQYQRVQKRLSVLSCSLQNLFMIAKTLKQPKCLSTDEWIKKMLHTHTHTNTQLDIIWPLKTRTSRRTKMAA